MNTFVAVSLTCAACACALAFGAPRFSSTTVTDAPATIEQLFPIAAQQTLAPEQLEGKHLVGWQMRTDGEYTAVFGDTPVPNVTPISEEQFAAYAARMVERVNEERARAGLTALVVSPNLSFTASWWADKLAGGRLGEGAQNFWRHSDVADMVEMEQTTGRYCMADKKRENITAILQNIDLSEMDIVEHQMQNFLNSAPHRANILWKDAVYIGIGYAQGEDGSIHCVQHYGLSTAGRGFSPDEYEKDGVVYIYDSPVWGYFPKGTFHVDIAVIEGKTVYQNPYIVPEYAYLWDERELPYGEQTTYIFE